MERVRLNHVRPSDGGRPCDSSFESVTCGDDACDQDCTLSEWTKWSSCSKACDGGFRLRRRDVIFSALGTGTCPDEESSTRQQYRRCNEQHCQPKEGPILNCVAKLDVVIMLDGSSSIGQVGWEATKRLVEALVRAFQVGEEMAQVAVLLYSGPKDWTAYKNCTASSGTADMLGDCNLIWVSHFTTDTPTLQAEVSKLLWPQGSTLTSAALASVEAELKNGRSSANSIVIAVTDGNAMNPRKTASAARSLRQKARLLWVPVTRNACLSQIKAWASRPVADNVLAVRDFAQLDQPENINKIIADACPKVH